MPSQCRLPGRRRAAWTALAIVLVLACGEESSVPTEAEDAGKVKAYADLTVSRAMGSGGLLASAELNRRAAQQEGVGALLSEARAREFAGIAAHQFGPMLRGYLERGHGGAISIAALRVCGRSYFVESPFKPLPDEIAMPLKKQFGPWWIVGLCGAGGSTQVSIAVSAYATDLWLEHGELRFPRIFGNEFKMVGVPANWDGAVPVSPENAIVAAGKHTGRKIAAVPYLVAPDLNRAFPQAAAWRLALGSAAGSTQPAPNNGDVLYLGVSGTLVGIPGLDQPARLSAPALSSAATIRMPMPTTAAVLRAAGRPTEDVLVDLVPREAVPLHFTPVGGN